MNFTNSKISYTYSTCQLLTVENDILFDFMRQSYPIIGKINSMLLSIHTKISKFSNFQKTVLSNFIGSYTVLKFYFYSIMDFFRIDNEIPNCACNSHLGQFTLYDCITNRFAVILSFPRINHAVSTTEVGSLVKLKDHFEARNTILLGLVVDSIENIRSWVNEIMLIEDCGDVKFPIIADKDASVCI